ncbi:TIGR00730 family Rossman fold protein [Saccharomonospora xinjiangensis]|uniref:Cytokinin riboside 5'-monophosphate phosphoribohydrolase n=1 Tax=Saccharomonospora xinjiangensis XJ-54 TaxID=882086 RepID=I0V0F9_9PSEU|nr:TIGR00730 family Rossman fold protein [Saccharomonospora xinjiangensis]EID53612.1 TIGR00730 family protein [Saccharomonospora xinjiangensis XJ-54]
MGGHSLVKRLCVFCGSSSGKDPAYAVEAAAVGKLLAERGIGVVYGGGQVGLMGVVADAALEAGGEVIGVIPKHLMRAEIAHHELTKLHVVEDMHERKATMARLSDGFVALPGGAGTLEELFEVWTWAQLGLHAKPVGLLDVRGYYTKMAEFLDHMVTEGFLGESSRDLVIVNDDAEALLDAFSRHTYTPIDKWAS